MTPIKIEPNSGTKMAGVKIVLKHWKIDFQFAPEEIVFVGAQKVFTKDKDGREMAWNILNAWYLYEEPKAEVKSKHAFVAFRGKGEAWHVTSSLYKSVEDFKDKAGFISLPVDIIFPARFDAEGFLIIPEELK